MATPIIELRQVTKSFGPVSVLRGVDFKAYAGKVTALVGDNGAGKSTLIKGLAGVQQYDGGEVLFDGKAVELHHPREAARHGIEVVYQDLALCDNLDIVQNMFLGREETGTGTFNEGQMEVEAARALMSLSVKTVKSLRQKVSSLSGGQRQTVAIARSVVKQAKVVILDEPTAALGVAQTEQVLNLVRRLADSGVASKRLAKLSEGRPNAVDLIKNGQIQMVINTPGGMIPRRDENLIRAAAYAHSVCIMTTITGAAAAINGIRALKQKDVGVRPIQSYRGNVNVV